MFSGRQRNDVVDSFGFEKGFGVCGDERRVGWEFVHFMHTHRTVWVRVWINDRSSHSPHSKMQALKKKNQAAKYRIHFLTHGEVSRVDI